MLFNEMLFVLVELFLFLYGLLLAFTLELYLTKNIVGSETSGVKPISFYINSSYEITALLASSFRRSSSVIFVSLTK